MLKEIFEWLKAIAYALVIVFIFNLFFGITTVYNTSMVPTLVEGNMLFISKISNIDRGDIITFETEITLSSEDIQTLSPIKRIFVDENTSKNLIKRIIGLPGDSIAIKDGELFINDVRQEEAYINTVTNGNVSIQSIPEHKYFVMGDNRAVSLDSRNEAIGLVDEEAILGEAIMRFWPIFDLKIF